MNQKEIEEQLAAQKKTTERATRSRRAAINYLVSIGAIKAPRKIKKSSKKK